MSQLSWFVRNGNSGCRLQLTRRDRFRRARGFPYRREKSPRQTDVIQIENHVERSDNADAAIAATSLCRREIFEKPVRSFSSCSGTTIRNARLPVALASSLRRRHRAWLSDTIMMHKNATHGLRCSEYGRTPSVVRSQGANWVATTLFSNSPCKQIEAAYISSTFQLSGRTQRIATSHDAWCGVCSSTDSQVCDGSRLVWSRLSNGRRSRRCSLRNARAIARRCHSFKASLKLVVFGACDSSAALIMPQTFVPTCVWTPPCRPGSYNGSDKIQGQLCVSDQVGVE